MELRCTVRPVRGLREKVYRDVLFNVLFGASVLLYFSVCVCVCVAHARARILSVRSGPSANSLGRSKGGIRR